MIQQIKIKKRIFEIIEKAARGDQISRLFDLFIMSLIFLNIVAIILETVKSISVNFSGVFRFFEIFSVIVFSLEYILRLWVCILNEDYQHPVKGRIKYMLTPLAVVDLLAVLPFYLPMVMVLDLRFLRAIRLLRLLRLLKIGRYSESIRTFANVFKKKKEELVITLFVIIILLIIVSSLMYYIENEAQPEIYSSIPASMWWGIATLTTVGYGDVYPITPLGKLFGALIAILGIGMFALPAGILGSGFVEEMQKKKLQKRVVCPHCKKEIS